MSIDSLNPKRKIIISPEVVHIARPVDYNTNITTNITVETTALASTTLTANATTGATSLSVDSIADFNDGDGIIVVLNSGALHQTTINGAPSGSTLIITDAMPSLASFGNRIELSLAFYNAFADHVADLTAVHGIADTTDLVTGVDGIYVKNSFYALGGEDRDMSMTGFYDRNELAIVEARGGSTIVTITGAGSVASETRLLYDGISGKFFTLSETDLTTTKIVIDIDTGATQPHYSLAMWQPFVQYRYAYAGGPTWYDKITVEVSSDNITFYKPSGGEWQTTSASSEMKASGYWLGKSANPGGLIIWRYARFTLETRIEESGYANKHYVWIPQIGIRHHSAPMARYLLNAGGGIMYGNLSFANMPTSAAGLAAGTLWNNGGVINIA